MDGENNGKPYLERMTWGYFRKHPFVYHYFFQNLSIVQYICLDMSCVFDLFDTFNISGETSATASSHYHKLSFNCLIFTSKFGEVIQFDEHRWVSNNHHQPWQSSRPNKVAGL